MEPIKSPKSIRRAPLTISFFSNAPRKSIRTSFVALVDGLDDIDGGCTITFFDIDIGGMAWNNFSGVLSDDANEKSAESPRTLSKSLKKWEVDEDES